MQPIGALAAAAFSRRARVPDLRDTGTTPMTSKMTSLMLGLGLVAASAGVAAAADWNNGGESYKRYGGAAAVPVPAPAPVPMSSADWYVRGDLNFPIGSSGSLDTTGVNPAFDVKRPDDMPRYFGGSIGVGRYITPSIRAEMAIDYRSQQRMASGAVTYAQVVRSAGTPITVSVPATLTTPAFNVLQSVTLTNHYSVNDAEEARVGNYAAMLNFYYDLKDPSYRGFTPYVGAGVGISMHTLRRSNAINARCLSQDIDYAAVPVAGIPATSATGSCSDFQTQGTASGTAYGLAGALMAGLGYEISPGVTWDTGYRFMYQNGHVSVSRDALTGPSIINIGDRIDHEIRTGVRWNID